MRHAFPVRVSKIERRCSGPGRRRWKVNSTALGASSRGSISCGSIFMGAPSGDLNTCRMVSNWLRIAARPSSRAGRVPSGENICASSAKNPMMDSSFCDITALKNCCSVSRASLVACDILFTSEHRCGRFAKRPYQESERLESILQLARFGENRNRVTADLRIVPPHIGYQLDTVGAHKRIGALLVLNGRGYRVATLRDRLLRPFVLGLDALIVRLQRHREAQVLFRVLVTAVHLRVLGELRQLGERIDHRGGLALEHAAASGDE